MKMPLQMISCSFNVNEAKKTVTAVLQSCSYGRAFYCPEKHTTIGIAQCNDSDNFDVKKGKRIARAKAEKEAYICHRKYLLSQLKRIKREADNLSANYERTQYYIQHQKDYINSFKQ